MWRRESGQLKELAIIWCEEREKCNIRPVEVKDVYFNHENWTFEVDPIGPKHVISELRLSGLHFLFKCLLYDGIKNLITGEMSPNI